MGRVASWYRHTYEAIRLIKKNLPEERWPEQIKGDYEIEWKFDVPSFLEYYPSFISHTVMVKMTGINQKQLSNIPSNLGGMK